MNFDIDASGIRQLLDELDARLRAADIAATVYLVGGAAIALQLPDIGRRTQDIDGITNDSRVARVVAEMAQDLGLPEKWLNGNARPFVPTPPGPALAAPTTAGLHVVIAPLSHLLAMKLAAGRARDQADISALAASLGVDAEHAVQLTLEAYGLDALEVFTSVDDVRFEAETIIGPRR